jgi:hypothetical protein
VEQHRPRDGVSLISIFSFTDRKPKNMNMQQFTDECLKIHQDVSRRMPLTLKSDKSATLDKPERKTETLKFCIWGQSSGFCWDRNYASYHIIYDPAGNLDQKGLLQVRFMFFLNRKQTDKSLNQCQFFRKFSDRIVTHPAIRLVEKC